MNNLWHGKEQNHVKDKSVSLIMAPQPIMFYSISTLPDGTRTTSYHIKYTEWIMHDIIDEMQAQYAGLEKPKAVLLSFSKAKKD
ncbi:MAG: hypothetical protein GX846_02520 [Deltaproteobacteria bacterium]|nr:hypothetical protein [Deltaproteobacteria bacterium]